MTHPVQMTMHLNGQPIWQSASKQLAAERRALVAAILAARKSGS